MKYKSILLLLIGIASLSAFILPAKNVLNLKTSSGHTIKVFKGQISYDNRVIFKSKYDDDILYENKANRLIEDKDVIFLFIAVSDRPNLEKLNAFLITPKESTLVANAILSPIKDYDGDGYLEFGGRDLTEKYSNRDSMYYIPTAYYEIRDGKIRQDNSLTKSEDIKLNGLYLPPGKQLDKNGNCCKVVPIPNRHHTLHVQTPTNLIAKSFMSSDTITVLATQYVLNGKDEVTNVDHFIDGSWLFYSNNRTYTTETSARKVKLGSIIKLDRSILLLSWLPKGYVATRASKTASWNSKKLKDKD